MRDDSMKWDAALGDQRVDIQGDGFQVTLVQLPHQTIISGPIETCLTICGQQKAIAWPNVVEGSTYALRLRRDRLLCVNGPDLADGWHDQGVAVSDMSGAYGVVEISGPKALNLLNQGTELDTALPSGSVARQFHGFAALIYRWQSQSCYRLHVQRCYLDAVWQRLQM